MLVSFHKGFIMEGENTITVKKHLWSKPESKRHKIYCTTGVYGICDDYELEAEIERLINDLQYMSYAIEKDEFTGYRPNVYQMPID